MIARSRFEVTPLRLTGDTVEALAAILQRTVAAGGSVHFMDPAPLDEARAYWTQALSHAATGGRIILGSFVNGALTGTVTLFLDTPPNQPFRAEVWKLMVDPPWRGRGHARALMLKAEDFAHEAERCLLNLDTAVDGGASELYESLGWVRAGVIPDFAYKPQGGLVGTAIYYKQLVSP